MPRPFQIVSQSDYLIKIVDINSHTLEANWSGSALFAKARYILVQQDNGLRACVLQYSRRLHGPRHAKTCLWAYVNSESPDLSRSLIRVSSVREQNDWILQNVSTVKLIGEGGWLNWFYWYQIFTLGPSTSIVRNTYKTKHKQKETESKEGCNWRWPQCQHKNKKPWQVCLCWGFTAQSTQWGHVERGWFT